MKTRPFKEAVMSDVSSVEFPVELIVTRGLPGCGKSTWAFHTVSEESAKGRRIVRVNRDDLRHMALPVGYSKPDYESEKLISIVRDTALEQLLKSGVSVIVDDTNLVMKYARNLADLAHRLVVGFRVIDFFDVSLETCIERDAARRSDVGFVGEAVIRSMHTRFLAGGHPGLVLPREQAWEASDEPYVPNVGLSPVVLCDIDGTLALMGDRGPYDESCVMDDLPNPAVVDVLQALIGEGSWERMSRHDKTYDVIFMSGRTEACRDATEEWLAKHVGMPRRDIVLHMRAVGDTRPDHVVKLELFNHHIRHWFNVCAVLDDRNQVVKLWRSLGLTCLQVADGNF